MLKKGSGLGRQGNGHRMRRPTDQTASCRHHFHQHHRHHASFFLWHLKYTKSKHSKPSFLAEPGFVDWSVAGFVDWAAGRFVWICLDLLTGLQVIQRFVSIPFEWRLQFATQLHILFSNILSWIWSWSYPWSSWSWWSSWSSWWSSTTIYHNYTIAPSPPPHMLIPMIMVNIMTMSIISLTIAVMMINWHLIVWFLGTKYQRNLPSASKWD